MQLLTNKNIIITGLISDRSIAYGVAKQCKAHGANLIFTYQNEKHQDRIAKLTSEFAPVALIKCDVALDEDLINLATITNQHWAHVDGVLHAIAYSAKEGISGDIVDNVTREIYQQANDISAYSFLAIGKYLRPLLIKSVSPSLVTMSYYGAEKVMQNYNMMGIAKAALEATSKYMADSLGAENIRVNSISAGPIKTLAASGISDFGKILHHVAQVAPLRRNVDTLEVGNTAVFLFSSMSSAITGENIHVDCGYHITSGSKVSE